MAIYESRGYAKKVEIKTAAGTGAQRCQFDLAVSQKRKENGVEVKETIYIRCVDFKCENIPVDGEYLGVTGYLTLSPWAKNGKNGFNADLTVKSYEKLAQKEQTERPARVAKSADAPPPSDPFLIQKDKP